MDEKTCVSSWEKWREIMGPNNSRHRAAVMEYLKEHPAVLYWGDSWFSTPLYLNLCRQSAKQIQGVGMVIGKPGAEAAELFSPSKVKSILGRLLASPFDVLCLSAGGNDCLDDRLKGPFKAWHAKGNKKEKISAAEAFKLLVKFGAFETVFNAYDGLLSKLGEVQGKRPTFKIMAHPYVPITRIGVKADLTVKNIGLIAWLKGDVGPWLWRPMEAVLPDKNEGKVFADLLLVNGHKESVLEPLAKKYRGLFSVADFGTLSGAGSKLFWNDEIHPTEAGFLALSRPFNQHLAGLLPAKKRAAVGF